MMRAEVRGGNIVSSQAGAFGRLLSSVLAVLVLAAVAVVGASVCAEEPADSAGVVTPVENAPSPASGEGAHLDDAATGAGDIEQVTGAQIEQVEPDASPPHADIDGFVVPLKLEDTSGHIHSVPAIEGAKKLTVLAFLLTADPASKRIRRKLPGLERQADSPETLGVRVLVLVPTCDPEIAPVVRAWKVPLQVCIDIEGRMAEYFLIRRVPSFVIVDATGVVRFHGSFRGLINALAELEKGVKVSKKRTPVFGCVLADRLRGEKKLMSLTGSIAVAAPEVHRQPSHSTSKEKSH